MGEKKGFSQEELIKRYKIDIGVLEREQHSLSKGIKLRDEIDFTLAESFGGVNVSFFGNKIICGIVVIDRDFEIIDQSYVIEKVSFPYLIGFRAYRELPTIIRAFEKLSIRPDVFFISGMGISHPRLGLASHFSLSVGVPSIGISENIIDCELNGEDILKEGNIVGKVFVSKEKSRPMYISPGNGINVESSIELVKRMIKLPHKRPEPIHLAGKYVKDVRKEVGK